jgi:hypothetical protein
MKIMIRLLGFRCNVVWKLSLVVIRIYIGKRDDDLVSIVVIGI